MIRSPAERLKPTPIGHYRLIFVFLQYIYRICANLHVPLLQSSLQIIIGHVAFGIISINITSSSNHTKVHLLWVQYIRAIKLLHLRWVAIQARMSGLIWASIFLWSLGDCSFRASFPTTFICSAKPVGVFWPWASSKWIVGNHGWDRNHWKRFLIVFDEVHCGGRRGGEKVVENIKSWFPPKRDFSLFYIPKLGFLHAKRFQTGGIETSMWDNAFLQVWESLC